MRINRGCPWAKLKKLCIKGALLYPFVDCSKIIVQLSSSNFPIIVFIFSNYDIFIYSTPIADLYSLSYLWISGLSFGAAIVVGLIASFALGNYTWLIIHFWFVQRQFTLLCDAMELAALIAHGASLQDYCNLLPSLMCNHVCILDETGTSLQLRLVCKNLLKCKWDGYFMLAILEPPFQLSPIPKPTKKYFFFFLSLFLSALSIWLLTDRQTDRQTDVKTDEWTDRQKEKKHS